MYGDLAAGIGGPMPVAVGPRVGRVVEQVLERLAVGTPPFEPVALPFAVDAHRHEDAMMHEITEQGVERPLTLELVEDQADGGLDLFVGIDLEGARGTSEITDRGQSVDLAPDRLVPLAPVHPFLEDM
jgi:hypothetical protein